MTDLDLFYSQFVFDGKLELIHHLEGSPVLFLVDEKIALNTLLIQNGSQKMKENSGNSYYDTVISKVTQLAVAHQADHPLTGEEAHHKG